MSKEIGDVKITDMSLEDLQKMYSAEPQEGDIPVAEEEVVEEEVVEEEVVEEKVEEEVVEEMKETPVENKELSDIKKQLEGLQSLIGKWGNEMSEVRKLKDQIPSLTTTQKESVKEQIDNDPNFFENLAKDPTGTIKKLIDSELQSRKQVEDSQISALVQTKNIVNHVVPEFDKLIPTIAELIKEDTKNDNAPEIFTNNVYKNDVPFLIAMGKRAQDRTKIKELEGIIEGLKKGTKTSPTSPTAVKATKGTKTDFTQKDLHKMSLSELEEMYKNTK